jgi:hypothetical protein
VLFRRIVQPDRQRVAHGVMHYLDLVGRLGDAFRVE